MPLTKSKAHFFLNLGRKTEIAVASRILTLKNFVKKNIIFFRQKKQYILSYQHQ
jgi:hypothetical protein